MEVGLFVYINIVKFNLTLNSNVFLYDGPGDQAPHIGLSTETSIINGSVKCLAFQSYIVFIGEYFLLQYMSSRMKFKGISLKVIKIINHDSYKYVKKAISYYGYKLAAPSYIKISVLNITMEGPNIDDCMHGGIFIMEVTPSGRPVKPGTFKTNVQLCNMAYSREVNIPLSFVSGSNTTYIHLTVIFK